MNQTQRTAIIMAAGQSKRMKSSTTKVLHPVAGKSVLSYTLDSIRETGIDRIVVVVGRQSEEVKQRFEGEGLEFVDQLELLGTGHAAYVGLRALKEFRGDILVLCGDVPLIRSKTLRLLTGFHREKQSVLTLLTACLPEPAGYGRIVRGEGDTILRIVEEKEAGDDDREIQEINSGIMCFESAFMSHVLDELMSEERAGEYYLTDVIEMARTEGHEVNGIQISDPLEIQGINDRWELSIVEGVLRERIPREHMRNGITMINPTSTVIDNDVMIGEDTVIHQGVILEGKTCLGRGCSIGPYSRIVDSILGENVCIDGWNYIKRKTLYDGSRMKAYESAGEEER